LEIDAELLATWKDFVKDRGETLREAAERAFSRDMASPPTPVPHPPLPPMTISVPIPPPGKAKNRK
jgi:hypothetical protein